MFGKYPILNVFTLCPPVCSCADVFTIEDEANVVDSITAATSRITTTAFLFRLFILLSTSYFRRRILLLAKMQNALTKRRNRFFCNWDFRKHPSSNSDNIWSPNRHLSSYNNDNYRAYVYPDSDDEKVVKRGEGDYPLEIIRSDGLIRITTQTPFVNDKNNIKVKVYNDSSVEISIDNDGDPLQNNKNYYRIVEIPKDADIETAKCTYRNGILEITFKQKKR
jgi:HSP20 family molecular chaperone IbpA